MQLFIWLSDLLKQYRPGHIIVLAPNEETARDLARAQFDTWLAEHRSWFNPNDPEDAEEIEELRQKLERDLESPPVDDTNVYFISGSE
jgi:hypothetical protein